MTTPTTFRLDPAPSKAYTWLSWEEAAEAVVDDRGRTVQPAGPVLTVRYRTTGLETAFWPVSYEEAVRICRPGEEFDFSIGRAASQVLAHKSKRMVKPGERQETKKQRTEQEKRAGRMWI